MELRSICAKLMLAAALSLAAPWVCAQDGLQGAFLRANIASAANAGMPLTHTLVAADFDGDNKPDGVLLVQSGLLRPQSSLRKIELHFTSGKNADLAFESNEAMLAILAVDVNSDGATDIVIEQPFTHKRLQVWLNDGHGGFRRVPTEEFPSAAPGNGQRLDSPFEQLHGQALCLPSQRGTETAERVMQPLAARPRAAGRFKLSSTNSSSLSAVFSLSLSRAPPFSAT